MIFTSIAFALFFLIVCTLYYLLPTHYRWIWLLLSSIFFYVYADPSYIIIAFAIIGITFYAGKMMQNSAPKKAFQLYLFALIANISLLIFFKYINFFTTTAFNLLNFTRLNLFHSTTTYNNFLLLNIIAPLGISYITFQAIGYLIEIKRENHRAETNLGHFATFLLFFPKIIAGPVERAHNFLPQLKQEKLFNYYTISIGLKLILWGLFKKLVIADRLSLYVSAVLGNVEHHSAISLIVAVVFYVFQMYADFSGYSDMAVGFAKILGFDIVQNFNRPLLAKSMTEFWRKWHISLSTWFADYFYNPIALAKRDWGKWSVVYAFFVTFIVLGFWHGANFTFIMFGALQGFILTIEFLTRKARKNFRKKIPSVINTFLGIAFTISFYSFSLIFFRAKSIAQAFSIIKRIFTAKGALYIGNPSVILFSVSGIIFLFLVEVKKEFYNNLFTFSEHKNWLIRNAYYCFLLFVILIAGVFDGGEFIYFQF